MTALILTTMRELDTRWNDGIQVRLLWCQHDGRVLVAVTDTRNGGAFSIQVAAGEDPHDVFHHPYAYAAWRRIETAPRMDSEAELRWRCRGVQPA